MLNISINPNSDFIQYPNRNSFKSNEKKPYLKDSFNETLHNNIFTWNVHLTIYTTSTF